MNQAFIIKAEAEYASLVYLVFASSEKEAKQILFPHVSYMGSPKMTCVMEVQAAKGKEMVIELGGYSE